MVTSGHRFSTMQKVGTLLGQRLPVTLHLGYIVPNFEHYSRHIGGADLCPEAGRVAGYNGDLNCQFGNKCSHFLAGYIDDLSIWPLSGVVTSPGLYFPISGLLVEHKTVDHAGHLLERCGSGI